MAKQFIVIMLLEQSPCKNRQPCNLVRRCQINCVAVALVQNKCMRRYVLVAGGAIAFSMLLVCVSAVPSSIVYSSRAFEARMGGSAISAAASLRAHTSRRVRT